MQLDSKQYWGSQVTAETGMNLSQVVDQKWDRRSLLGNMYELLIGPALTLGGVDRAVLNPAPDADVGLRR